MKPFVLGLCAFLVAAGASAQDTDRSITIGEKFSIRSAVLGEERPYWVHVPASYRETKYRAAAVSGAVSARRGRQFLRRDRSHPIQ